MNNKGTFYTVGMGPGDPDLLTIKGKKVIDSCPVIVYPRTKQETDVALNIAKVNCDLSDKTLIALPFPMVKDKAQLAANYRNNANTIAEYLNKGQDVCFLTIGDPLLYSTSASVKELLVGDGYDCRSVAGINSFTAVANRINLTLVDKDETMTVIPGSYREFDRTDADTLVIMKSARDLPSVIEFLRENKYSINAISDCGKETEKIYTTLDELEKCDSYFVTIIAKKDRT